MRFSNFFSFIFILAFSFISIDLAILGVLVYHGLRGDLSEN